MQEAAHDTMLATAEVTANRSMQHLCLRRGDRFSAIKGQIRQTLLHGSFRIFMKGMI